MPLAWRHNIANVNTMGFKRQRAIFTDVLGQSVAQAAGTSPREPALVLPISNECSTRRVAHHRQPDRYGNLRRRILHRRGYSQRCFRPLLFTRRSLPRQHRRKLANPDGLLLQGYQADDDGSITSTIGDLTVSGAALKASPTTSADLQIQLDSNATIPPAWDLSRTQPQTSPELVLGV